LLQSTGKVVDYVWIAQLRSHALFRWAFGTIGDLVAFLLRAHGVEGFGLSIELSYRRYRDIDAA
jgi:hypothetical protein